MAEIKARLTGDISSYERMIHQAREQAKELGNHSRKSDPILASPSADLISVKRLGSAARSTLPVNLATR